MKQASVDGMNLCIRQCRARPNELQHFEVVVVRSNDG